MKKKYNYLYHIILALLLVNFSAEAQLNYSNGKISLKNDVLQFGYIDPISEVSQSMDVPSDITLTLFGNPAPSPYCYDVRTKPLLIVDLEYFPKDQDFYAVGSVYTAIPREFTVEFNIEYDYYDDANTFQTNTLKEHPGSPKVFSLKLTENRTSETPFSNHQQIVLELDYEIARSIAEFGPPEIFNDIVQVRLKNISLTPTPNSPFQAQDFKLTAKLFTYDLKSPKLSDTPLEPIYRTVSPDETYSQPSTKNYVVFEWEPDNIQNCFLKDGFPSYEIQILRLYNDNIDIADYNELASNNEFLHGMVDWEKALSVYCTNLPEQGTGIVMDTITIAEGTGYYIWRVRPIGSLFKYSIDNLFTYPHPGQFIDEPIERFHSLENVYELGKAHYENSANFGVWSMVDYSDFTTSEDVIKIENIQDLQGATNSKGIFYYDQFDKDINWVYKRSFHEEDYDGTFINESMSYFDDLLKLRQTQTNLLTSNNSKVVSHVVPDYVGRSALTTLPIPYERSDSEGENLGFESIPYTAIDYDDNTCIAITTEPLEDNSGVIDKYYKSIASVEEGVPSAEGYPFTRTLFHRDNMNRPKIQSKAGEIYKIGSDRNVQSYFASASQEELNKMFGIPVPPAPSEAPDANRVHKQIVIDENGVVSVDYYLSDGRILASSLLHEQYGTIDKPNPEPDLSPLNENILSQDFKYTLDDNKFVSSKTLTLPVSADVDFKFKIDNVINKIEEVGCIPFCSDCDYKVELIIRNLDECDESLGLVDRITKEYFPIYESDGCFRLSENHTDVLQLIRNLSPGTYVFERIITVNNTIPPNSSPQKEKMERDQVTQLISNIIGDAVVGTDGEISTKLAELEKANITLVEFYDYLVDELEFSIEYVPGTSEIAFYTYDSPCCGKIKIPYDECEVCDIELNEYESYLTDKWDGETIGDKLLTDNFEDYFNNLLYNGFFNVGDFNTMISNMVTDGYSESILCDCWKNVVDHYDIYAQREAKTEGGDQEGIEIYYKFNEEFDILDAFLDCTGRKMEGFTPQGFDEAQWAYKYIPGNSTTYDNLYLPPKLMQNLKDRDGNDFNPPPGWQPDVAGKYNDTYRDTDNYMNPGSSGSKDGFHDLKTWEEFYIAIMAEYEGAIFKNNERNDNNKEADFMSDFIFNFEGIECGEDLSTLEPFAGIQDELESRCETTCEAYALSVRNKLIEMYNNNFQSVEGQTITFDDNGNSLPFDPVNHTHHISTYEIECAIEHIIADCKQGCEFEWDEEYIQTNPDRCLYTLKPANIDLFTMIYGGVIADISYASASGCPSVSEPNHNPAFGEIDPDFELVRNINIIPGEVSPCNTVECSNFDCSDQTLAAKCSTMNDWLYSSLLDPNIFTYHQNGDNPYFEFQDDKIYRDSPTMANIIHKRIREKYFDIFGEAPCWEFKCFEYSASDFYYDHNNDGVPYLNDCISTISRDYHSNMLSTYVDLTEDEDIYYFRRLVGDVRYGIFQRYYFSSWTQLMLRVNETTCALEFGFSTYGGPYFIPLSGDYFARFCEQSCNLCVRYKIATPDILDELTPYASSYTLLGCEELMAKKLRKIVDFQIQKCLDGVNSNIKREYETICENIENIASTTTIAYNSVQYHFTLFYYDRAGNLIATVPPEGVDLAAQNHQMMTYYKYDSQNRLVQTFGPDSYISPTAPPNEAWGEKYFYDKFGRLIYKTTPENIVYFVYDRYNRLIETGELDASNPGSPLSMTVIDPLLNFDFDAPYALPHVAFEMITDMYPAYTGDRLDYIKYFYDEPVYEGASPGELPYPYEQNGIRYEQENVFGRLSYSFRDNYGSGGVNDKDVTYSYYSYDAHGNIKWVIKTIEPPAGIINNEYYKSPYQPELPLPLQTYENAKIVSKIDYDYDLISGNISQIIYNKNRFNEFRQKYYYNEGNQLKEVYTSRNGFLWEREAEYNYYKHGPVKQVEVGQDKLQILDYSYTINGWMKAMNSSYDSFDYIAENFGAAYDNDDYPADLYGFALEYHNDDYVKKATALSPVNIFDDIQISGNSLYNGIITGATHMYSPAFNSDYNIEGWFAVDDRRSGYFYEYDVLYRLIEGGLRNYLTSSWDATTTANVEIEYDGNSNITYLKRINDHKDIPMSRNDITYNYYAPGGLKSNKIANVSDAALGTTAYRGGTHNFEYDQMGRRSDDQIKWTFDNKVRETQTSNPDTTAKYMYDESGNRVYQYCHVQTHARQYWVYGLNGELLSHYRIRPQIYEFLNEVDGSGGGVGPVGGGEPGGAILAKSYFENNLFAYGVAPYSRVTNYKLEPINLGPDPFDTLNYEYSFELMFTNNITRYTTGYPTGYPDAFFYDVFEHEYPDNAPPYLELTTLFRYNRILDTRRYELKDHVGNVRVVYGDYRINEPGSTNHKDDVLRYHSFADYYPYGLMMDRRTFERESYLFGFQGMERDADQPEDQYHTLFRQYDAVLGRWWSNDPLQSMYPSYSPYTAMAANPVNFIDPLGLAQTDPNEHLPPGEEVGEMRTHEGSNFRWDGEQWKSSTGEVVVEGNRDIPPPSQENTATISTPKRNFFGQLLQLQKYLEGGNVFEQIQAGYLMSGYSLLDATWVTGTNLGYSIVQSDKTVTHLDNTVVRPGELMDAFIELEAAFLFWLVMSGAGTAVKGGLRTVDDLIAAGTKLPKVKGGGQISVKGNIDDVFNSLSKGGKTTNLPNGRVQVKLPDGTTLTKYPAGSGSPTIQVNQGGKITKVRFE